MIPTHPHLALVLDTLPDLVSMLDDNLVYRYVNATYENWFDLKREQILGKTMNEILGENVVEAARPYLDRVLKGETLQFETTALYRYGQPRRILAHYAPTKDDQGRVTGFVVSVQDLTKIDSMNAQLRASERRLKHALEATGEGVWDWSVAENMVRHNEQWCRLLGLEDGFLEHPLDEFVRRIHPDDAAAVMASLQVALNSTASYTSEHRMLCNDGRYIWVEDRGNVVERDASGTGLRMVGSFKDITEVREQQQYMMQASKMASLGEMAGGIAHEINNPLAVIIGSAAQIQSALHKGNLDGEILTRNLHRIEETGARISRIVKGLRSFSRNSENDSMQLTPLKQIVEETLELCGERFKMGSVMMKVACDPELQIQCRPAQISQILLNLLNNAFDAVQTLDEKWVELEAMSVGSSAFVFVTDSGKGIRMEIVAKLMQPFFTSKGVGKGTGLGLSIAKGLAEDHHGELRYDPKCPNTRFVLELPAVRNAARAKVS